MIRNDTYLLSPFFLYDIKDRDDIAVSKEERSINQTERWVELEAVSNCSVENVFPFIRSTVILFSCFKTQSRVPLSINKKLSTISLN